MAKVQIVFYSMYGHIYKMAEAVAEGARQVPKTEVTIYQVQELMPDEVLEKSGAIGRKHIKLPVPIRCKLVHHLRGVR